MKTNKPVLVSELLADRYWLYLVRFGQTVEDQFLALARQNDGRIDLVDIGYADTGINCADWTLDELESELNNWLRCIEATPEERAYALEQFQEGLPSCYCSHREQ